MPSFLSRLHTAAPAHKHTRTHMQMFKLLNLWDKTPSANHPLLRLLAVTTFCPSNGTIAALCLMAFGVTHQLKLVTLHLSVSLSLLGGPAFNQACHSACPEAVFLVTLSVKCQFNLFVSFLEFFCQLFWHCHGTSISEQPFANTYITGLTSHDWNCFTVTHPGLPWSPFLIWGMMKVRGWET